MLRFWLLAALFIGLAGCGSETGSSAEADVSVHPGEEIYLQSCFSCHAAGVAGAPRVGDSVAWAQRLEKGRDVLLQSTKEGMPPGMPAKGMCFSCSDQQFLDAIDYMLAESGVE